MAATSPKANFNGVTKGTDGALKYATYDRGDRLCDFSYAGYESGLTAPPTTVKEIIKLSPRGTEKDDTDQIQQAIDKVSQLPEGADGFRGAIVLGPGTFIVKGGLNITAPGVVLRGTKTTLNCKSGKPRVVITLGDDQKVSVDKKGVAITDTYVPVGAQSLKVASTSALKPGMRVVISRRVTAKWVASLDMNKLVRDGKAQTWIDAGNNLEIERMVTGIDGDSVTFDIPLCDSLDAAMFDDLRLLTVTSTNRVAHIGIENVSLVTYPATTEITAPSMTGIALFAVEDAWVRNCDFADFMTAIECNKNTRRTTLTENRITRHSSIPGSAKPFDIKIEGSQILVKGGSSASDKTVAFAVATLGSSSTFGPNAVVGYKLANKNSEVYPHMRWGGTGFLVQNVKGGGVEFINRESMGTGHGWTSANSVIWNCDGALKADSPPGYRNFVFGGRPTGSGTFFPSQSFGLYEAQLAERLKVKK